MPALTRYRGYGPSLVRRRYWTQERIAAALRDWYADRGEIPTAVEWRQAGPGHPSASAVRASCGSWSAALVAAGIAARAPYRRTRGRRVERWTRERVLAAVRRWVAEHGEVPAYGDWDPAQARRRGRPERVARFYRGEWPHAAVACRALGTSWAEVIRAAGLTPRGRRS